MSAEEIIKGLNELNYGEYGESKIVDLFKYYGASGGIIVNYHQGNQYSPPNLFTTQQFVTLQIE